MSEYHFLQLEDQIALALVQRGLELGAEIKVYDEEDVMQDWTSDEKLVLSALKHSGENLLAFRNKADEFVYGSVVLVWNNANDVLSDSSSNKNSNDWIDNQLCRPIVENIEKTGHRPEGWS